MTTPIPTINVNLRSCRCQEPKKRAAPCEPGNHRPECGGPILIPCPIPRSVTFSVALGECDIGCQHGPVPARPVNGHWTGCMARPIRVTCSIGGKTWEKSEVGDVDAEHPEFYDETETAALHACCERWEIIKALLTERVVVSAWNWPPAAEQSRLVQQRNAVFAALADMARGQAMYAAANEQLPEYCRLSYRGDPTYEVLARYITHLIEQVGALP